MKPLKIYLGWYNTSDKNPTSSNQYNIIERDIGNAKKYNCIIVNGIFDCFT